ncbi:MAG: patatin-like phospholipase family protein [Candidatus Auribacterota bacterium]
MDDARSLALEQLKNIESASDGKFEVIEHSEDGLSVRISISCSSIHKKPQGLPLRDRESFVIWIFPEFPFKKPSVWSVHNRFAGFPHVQWKRSLCLYQASSEWNPRDGMYGFITRLYKWLEMGAINQLDPEGAPIHPPVTYSSSNITIVPTANTPQINSNIWFGFAHFNNISSRCVEINKWSHFSTEEKISNVGATILIPGQMPFEYPETVSNLFIELMAHRIPKEHLMTLFSLAASNNNEDSPLYVIIGTAMRGVSGSEKLKQHLACWYIEPTIANGIRLALNKFSDNFKLREIGDKVEKIIFDWANSAKLEWCKILENRTEVTVRRDKETPLSCFKDRTVSLWGCGALGSVVAEYLVRAGVKKLILRDHGIVNPGILVRQNFNKNQIGKPKVEALEERIKQINPELEVESYNQDIIESVLNSTDWTDNSELIINTSANDSLAYKFELIRKIKKIRPILMLSMIISHKAQRGIVTLIPSDYTGGIIDTLRGYKISLSTKKHIKDFLDDFWPSENRNKLFQPEPGCSDATFLGSIADVSSLTSMMINSISLELQKKPTTSSCAHLVTQPHLGNARNHYKLYLEKDYILTDAIQSYEVRISQPTKKEILGWINRQKRLGNSDIETGGVLFGEIDDTLKVIWISNILGPPPDSISAKSQFICGIEGVKEFHTLKEKESRGSIRYIGMWHTHPSSSSQPSPIDLAGMCTLLNETGSMNSKQLLLIVGRSNSNPQFGAFLFDKKEILKKNQISIDISQLEQADALEYSKENIGICLSGGGSRAIAFHLGCLRALYDRKVLQNVNVISTVSGGSVIGAIYAYSNDSFIEFDKRIVNLLKSGLKLSILKRIFHLDTWKNKTMILEGALKNEFDNFKMMDIQRENLNIVINACELRSGSAFRFGNKESGCWRYGIIKDNNIDVAQAVAASAAYPIFLPPIKKAYNLLDRNGKIQQTELYLTDGGIYDNLGVTCFDPTKSSKYSYNLYKPDYIICCVAGTGLFNKTERPSRYLKRIWRSFNTVHRKLHDAGYDKLHKYQESGLIKGFILPYLGQQDKSLPYIPPDLIKREAVCNYPTDFDPMKAKDIELLSKRGEQLTRLLLDYYCPEL